jgi:hypothetical protein
MKNTTAASTPVAVKPAQTNAVNKSVSTRATEKIQSRIVDMSGEKTVHWLNKTARTIVNHYDTAAKKRKCTQAYWNGLISRYDALAKQAQTHGAWDEYCKSINKPTNHDGAAFIA